MKNNQPYLQKYRKHLRNHLTPAEATLWKFLKNKQVCQLKFRRQHSIGNYILDFYCPQIKLGIELDGEYHAYNEEYDLLRDKLLADEGITILRYENRMLYEHLNTILKDIEEYYENWKKNHPACGTPP